MKLPRRNVWLTSLLAIEILATPAAFANAIRFDFGTAETTAVTALFEDVAPNQVKLTISALALSGANSINSLLFNLNPSLASGNLIFTQTDSVGGVQGFANSANDSYKVNAGSGKFDIDLAFGSSPSFINGNSVTYSISGIDGLTVNDFMFLNTPAAGRIQTYASGSLLGFSGLIVVQGTPQTVPETASTFGLLGMALLALSWFARRPRNVVRQ